MEIKNRLLRLATRILVTATIICVVGFFAHLAEQGYTDIVVAQAQDHLLLHAEGLSANIQLFLEERKKSLRAFSADPKVQDRAYRSVPAPGCSPGDPICKEFLDANQGIIDRVYILGATGNIVEQASHRDEKTGTDLAKRPEIARLLKEPQAYAGEASRHSEIPALSILEPLFHGEEFAGIAGLEISAETIRKRFLRPLVAGNRSYVRVLDERGELWGQPENRPAARELIGYAPLSVGQEAWSLAVSRDYSEVIAPIRKQARRSAVISALIVILVYVFWASQLKTKKQKVRLEAESKYLKQMAASAEALRESEARYRLLAKNVTDVIWVMDLDMQLTYISPSVEQLRGFSPEEVMSQTWEAAVSPGSFDKVQKQIGRVNKTGNIPQENRSRPLTMEIEQPCKDGSTVWVEAKVGLLHDDHGDTVGFLGITRDITERRMAEAALRESEEKFRTISDQSLVGINILQDGRIVYLNDKATEINEYSREEMMSWGVEEFTKTIHPDDMDRLFRAQQDMHAKMAAGPGMNLVFRALTKTGKIKWVEQYSKLIQYHGRQATLSINIDITDRKRAEEEKAYLEKHLNQTQRMEALGTLAGGIAHDFNNMLSAITGYTELSLLENGENPRLQSNLDQVLRAGIRGRDLVKQILTFCRKNDREKELVDLRAIIKESLLFLRPSLPTTIELRQSSEVKIGTVLAEHTEIEQIVMNLCTNASHAMRENGGTLQVSLTEVDLGPDDEAPCSGLIPGAYLKMTVKDTGHGIEKEVMNHVFEPFFTTKDPSEGTGMGLSVVHGIVKGHGGAISADSVPGQGSTFSVFLPRVDQASSSELHSPESLTEKRARILFVDDEEPIVDMGRQMLEWFGHELFATTDSTEALEAFRAQPDAFDLVITDMTMPNMTGADLSQELLRIRPDIPIILCTGFSEVITPEKAKGLGIREMLVKPVLSDDLNKTIQMVLDQEIVVEESTSARILIVDDDDQIRGMLRQMLEGAGYNVIEASDGKIAAMLFRESSTDLIITDLVMPEKEGLELITELRKEFPEAKIIAISGGGRISPEEYLPMAKTLGALHTFQKPFTRDDLLAAIQDTLHK